MPNVFLFNWSSFYRVWIVGFQVVKWSFQRIVFSGQMNIPTIIEQVVLDNGVVQVFIKIGTLLEYSSTPHDLYSRDQSKIGFHVDQ